MTDDTRPLLAGAVKQYRDQLITAQFDPGKPAYQYPFQRGFNEGLELAIRLYDKMVGESHE